MALCFFDRTRRPGTSFRREGGRGAVTLPLVSKCFPWKGMCISGGFGALSWRFFGVFGLGSSCAFLWVWA